MFEQNSAVRQGSVGTAFQILELIYHATVRNVRKSHGNAVIGLLTSILQTVILVIVFYLMFTVLGLRAAAIRGDFLLYIMSGIFLFLCHNKAISSVTGAEGPSSPMMLHAPMSTAVSITSAALSSLYIQILSLFVVLFVYHAAVSPLEFYQPIQALGMVILAWFSGVAIGMLFLAVKPWMPEVITIVQQFYMRANMVTSGKMFVANSMPGYLISLFDWNPLFHTIDQARGFIFINYSPHVSSLMYPLYLSLVLLMLGLLGEFYTRKHVSASWGAGR
jgi:ABC-type polysaccharide/polyol phosphate export permease